MSTLYGTVGTKVSTPLTRTPEHPAARILVVEDNVDIREINAEILMRSGDYQVDAVEDGTAGWQALQAKHYDLLITDHDMPGVTGLELVQRLRAAQMTLPVILATGALPAEEFERQPGLRPAAILVKPFSSRQLLATVQEVLRQTDRCASVGQDRGCPRFAANTAGPCPMPAT